MPSFTINGITVETQEGATVLQAAREADIEIPTLCYHEALHPYGACRLCIVVPAWVAPLFSGFIVGYVCYDMIHYATHHLPMRWGVLKVLKRYHMLHHYKTPNERFGVSSPTWDACSAPFPTTRQNPGPNRRRNRGTRHGDRIVVTSHHRGVNSSEPPPLFSRSTVHA